MPRPSISSCIPTKEKGRKHDFWTFGAAATRETDDWAVRVRDLPEVVTSVGTLEEALALAAEAIEVAVAGRMGNDELLSRPSGLQPGEHVVMLPAALVVKAAVYAACKKAALGIPSSHDGSAVTRARSAAS